MNIESVTAPPEAADAFRDVASARADTARIVSQAQSYANDLLPRARGEARQMTESAEAYRSSKVNEAAGDAARFSAVAAEYAKAPGSHQRAALHRGAGADSAEDSQADCGSERECGLVDYPEGGAGSIKGFLGSPLSVDVLFAGRLGGRLDFGNPGQNDGVPVGEFSHQRQASTHGLDSLP